MEVLASLYRTHEGFLNYYWCNIIITFTPQIKGICCGLNVMCHISPGVLQHPLECATTSHQNAYNYATTFNGMIQKFQGTLIKISKTLLLVKHNISILIVDLSWGDSIKFIIELLFFYSKHICNRLWAKNNQVTMYMCLRQKTKGLLVHTVCIN